MTFAQPGGLLRRCVSSQGHVQGTWHRCNANLRGKLLENLGANNMEENKETQDSFTLWSAILKTRQKQCLF